MKSILAAQQRIEFHQSVIDLYQGQIEYIAQAENPGQYCNEVNLLKKKINQTQLVINRIRKAHPLTAHDIAAYPEFYNRVVLINGEEWECLGYSATGMTVKFARLVETRDKKLKQITINVQPHIKVEIVKS